MNFFGTPWDAPVVEEGHQVRTPVGWPCMICRLPIEDGQRGLVMPTLNNGWVTQTVMHIGCHILGIVGHQFGVCSCTGFAIDGPAAHAAGEELGRRINADWVSA